MLAKGGDPSRVEHLVGQQPPYAGQMRLVAQEAVDALAGRGQAPGELFAADGVGVGAKSRQGLGLAKVACDEPHTGSALGAGLGEQQRGAVGECPAGHPASGLAGLPGVDAQPSGLHEMDYECEPADAA